MITERVLDFAETIVYLPGIACQVYIGVADDRFRDRLQQAVIALMRVSPQAGARPYAAKELAGDLCVSTGIIDSVLLALEQEGLVRCSDGLYTLVDRDANTGLLRNTAGWMFWNYLERQFLPLLILDENGKGLPRHPASEHEYEESKKWIAGASFPSGAILEALRNPDFLIGNLGSDASMTMAHDLQVRAISREGARRNWPLAVMAQIRPRFGGAPGIFINESRPFPSWPPEVHFSPHLAKIIAEKLPEVHAELQQRAARIQKDFLRENCAEFLAKLGGEVNVRKEAVGLVEQALTPIKIAAPFNTTDLKSAAADAEMNFILFRHDASLISEASVRRDFATILQGIGCVVADLSADALANTDLLKALDDRHFNELKGLCEGEIIKYWRDRLRQLARQLGSDFRDWEGIASYFLNLDKFLNSVSKPATRHTLGTAFICWCAVPLFGEPGLTAQKHLEWMREAIKSMPDLPARYSALKDIRNNDKSVQRGLRSMSLEDFRADVYALWRAFGSGYR